LAQAYEIYNKALDKIEENAQGVAETINGLKHFTQKAKEFAKNYKGSKSEGSKAKSYDKFAEKAKNDLLKNKNVPDSLKAKLEAAALAAAPAWEFFKTGQPCTATGNSGGGDSFFKHQLADCAEYSRLIEAEMQAMDEVSLSLTCNCSPVISECSPIRNILDQIRVANSNQEKKITLSKVEGKSSLSNDTDWVSSLNGIDIGGKCFKIGLDFKFNGDNNELNPNKYTETKDGFDLVDANGSSLLSINILNESGQAKYLKQALLKEFLGFSINLNSLEGFYINKDRSIYKVEGKNSKSIDYYLQITDNKYKKIANYSINNDGLIEFPVTGTGFGRYGGVDKGGLCPYTGENVGRGDHFLLPETVAALLGVISETVVLGWEIDFGDMSSNNGSDPWEYEANKKNMPFGHHAGHGHFGIQSGQNIDFRYLDKTGKSFYGKWNSNLDFDDNKNFKLFEIAFAYGFQKNYATGKKYAGVNSSVPSHYDHGHFGASNVKVNIVKPFKVILEK
jgi:hypothetical protein